MRKIPIRRFSNDEQGVVGVVVTVLLVGLILAVMVLINNVYVPQWLEQEEANHMDTVGNQFTQLKYSLDLQSILKQPNAMSSYITLGNRELPILAVGRTFGTVQIQDATCNITLNSDQHTPVTYRLGTVSYASNNAYFVDQTYSYQSGALILSQGTANALSGKPSFVINENGENLSFILVNVSGTIGKRVATGYGTYPIHSEYVSANTLVWENVTNLTISIDSAYLNSWLVAFNSTLANSIYYSYKENYDIEIQNDQMILTIYDKQLRACDFSIVKIFSQVAPGWVED